MLLPLLRHCGQYQRGQEGEVGEGGRAQEKGFVTLGGGAEGGEVLDQVERILRHSEDVVVVLNPGTGHLGQDSSSLGSLRLANAVVAQQ